MYLFLYAALNPDCVENVTATLDTHKPSVTLKWDPPANARYAGEVSSYEIRIGDSDRDLSNLKCCNTVKVVKGSTTTAVITRESGLRPLTTFTRACMRSGDSNSPGWIQCKNFSTGGTSSSYVEILYGLQWGNLEFWVATTRTLYILFTSNLGCSLSAW